MIEKKSTDDVMAKFDYLSKSDEELSFVKGEMFHIFDKSNKIGGWLEIHQVMMKDTYPVIMLYH